MKRKQRTKTTVRCSGTIDKTPKVFIISTLRAHVPHVEDVTTHTNTHTNTNQEEACFVVCARSDKADVKQREKKPSWANPYFFRACVLFIHVRAEQV